jgi:hypothetical protein
VLYFNSAESAATVEEPFMHEKTCAACDCKLDSNSIKVRLRGMVVEVCCAECAEKLKEAQDWASSRDEARHSP